MCHNSRRSTAFSPVTSGALSDICHHESLAIYCSKENSLKLEWEQQVPFTLLQKPQRYKQHCTLLSSQSEESVGVGRTPTASQALHWAPKGLSEDAVPPSTAAFLAEREAQRPRDGVRARYSPGTPGATGPRGSIRPPAGPLSPRQ